MKSGKWNVLKAMWYGAIAGAPILLARSVMLGEDLPIDLEALFFFAAGGVVGGILLFGVVAGVRNLFVK